MINCVFFFRVSAFFGAGPVSIARFVVIVGLILVSGLSPFLSAQNFVISEFMASNEATLDDEDGDFEDWIEIFNQGATPQSLSGWYLTDDAGELKQWAFPEVTLNPGEWLVVFASGKDRSNAGSELHLNFKLSASGEYLALVRPDGVTVEDEEGPSYPQQVTDISFSGGSYFATPTPGSANSGGATDLGPLVRSVTSNVAPLDPTEGVFVVEVEVVTTLNPVSFVALYSQVMYGRERALFMNDSGFNSDAIAGDGIYTAEISISNLEPGEMLRWRVEARDNANNIVKSPAFFDPSDSPEYYGTIAETPSILSSNLPVLHWFTPSPAGSGTLSGSSGSVYYLGEFYDNIYVNLHGQSSAFFPKKSYNFDFNKGDRFLPMLGGKRAKDINLITNWADKSKTRNTIGYEMIRLSGHPAHYSFPIRVQQNGEFFSTADFVEDGDDRYLERVDLDGEGALYKMDNPLVTSSIDVEKKTRKEEGNSDLATVISGLGQSGDAKLRYGYDHINIPATINYLAVMDMINNDDHGYKNYYMYRNTNGTQEWQPLAWDVDLSFGRNWRAGPQYFDDAFRSNNLRAGPSNRLKTLIFNDATLNAMFLRRVRSLMDQFYGSPAAPVNYVKNRVNELVALIDPANDNASTGSDDADLDYQKWGSWGNNNAMRTGAIRIIYEYLPNRRNQLYGLSEVPAAQGVSPSINITEVSYNPASNGASPDQRGEYFVLHNPNLEAVDCSDWVISGGVSMILPSGAVIPAGGLLYVGRDAVGFRSRSVSPRANEQRYLVSGYDGQLSARGETIELHDATGAFVQSLTYSGNETLAQTNLRVTEIMYAPAEPTSAELNADPTLRPSDFEFIELVNLSDEVLDLSGTMFTEGVTLTFTAGSVAASGERVLVVADQAAFELRYGLGLPIVGVFSGSLSNAGEQLQIVDAVGENVLEFRYQDDWYTQTDGAGYSLVLLNPVTTAVTDYDEAMSWGVSADIGGDPGTEVLPRTMTYDVWRNQNFTAAELLVEQIVGDEVDLDEDGYSNIFEYALGLNPKVMDRAGAYAIGVSEVNGITYQSCTFRRRIDSTDLAYEVQIGNDLLIWNNSSLQVGAVTEHGDHVESVTIRDSVSVVGDDARYIRLKVVVSD